MKNRIVAIAFALLLPCLGLADESVNEDDLFSDPDVILQPVSTEPADEQKLSVGFSGEITVVMDITDVKDSSAINRQTYVIGNGFVDIRMKNDMKIFANMEGSYNARTSNHTSDVRELFLDFNINRRVYFRTGKQVLQWGRCALWNPTDLINVERKQFIRKIGSREGAYGLKLHAPFGTKRNIYGFIDTGKSPDSIDSCALALKYEWLVGNTEMAVSGWAKENYNPVIGYDISTRLGDVDIVGEVAVSRGDNVRKAYWQQGMLVTARNEDHWATQASINLSRGFRLGNFNDRLRVATELFYNGSGYKKDSVDPLMAVYIYASNLYIPNYFSRYYGAVFATVSRFLIPDMTLNANYIRNIDDNSGVVSAGVTYKNLSDYSIGLLGNLGAGPKGEYTLSGVNYNLQLTVSAVF